MIEPRTAAGLSLLREWEADPYLVNRVGAMVADRLLAIESEARRATVERIRERFSHARIDRDAYVFAILDVEAG